MGAAPACAGVGLASRYLVPGADHRLDRPGTRPGWDCQIMPAGDSPSAGLLRGGRYVYDPAAMRPPYRDEAAPDSHGEDWPRHR